MVRLYSLRRICILKPLIHRLGYHFVYLLTNGKNTMLYVHRLVLEVFIGKCPRDKECNHKNGIRNDNRLSNLERVTHDENMKARSWFSKITDRQVKKIRELYRTGEYSQTNLSKLFNVRRPYISKIVTRKRRI